MRDGACSGSALDAGDAVDERVALAICSVCDVRAQCLKLYGSTPSGVVGGMTLAERSAAGMVRSPRTAPLTRQPSWHPELEEETAELLAADVLATGGQVDWRAHALRLGTNTRTLVRWYGRFEEAFPTCHQAATDVRR